MVKWIIEGRKWFEKVNGNTYHKVYITDANTNLIVFESELTYGYGEQYKQTALDWLIKNGYFKETDRFNHELIRTDIYFNCSDVERKKDL